MRNRTWLTHVLVDQVTLNLSRGEAEGGQKDDHEEQIPKGKDLLLIPNSPQNEKITKLTAIFAKSSKFWALP